MADSVYLQELIKEAAMLHYVHPGISLKHATIHLGTWGDAPNREEIASNA